MLKQFGKDCVVIGGRLKPSVDGWPYMRSIFPIKVFLLSGDICNVNVNVNVDFCFRLSCELVR